MQQLSMAVADLQARADIQTEGRAVRHPVVSTPLAPRFPTDDDGIPDAWVGLSHEKALVSPSPVVQDRPGTQYVQRWAPPLFAMTRQSRLLIGMIGVGIDRWARLSLARLATVDILTVQGGSYRPKL